MIELSLVFCVSLLSLVLGIGLARWVSALTTGGSEHQRLFSALTRASEHFMWRAGRVSAQITAAALGLLGTLVWLRSTGDAKIGWGLLCWALGFTSTLVVPFVVVELGLRTCSRLLEASRDEVNRAIVVLLRGASSSAFIVEAAGLILVAAALGLREAGSTATATLEELRLTLRLLPALGVGAAVGALVLHASGTGFHTAAELAHGSLCGMWRLDADDERNPTLISTLVADHIGGVVPRVADALLLGLLSTIGTMFASFALLERNPALQTHALSIICLPLVMRAIGLLAASFGVLAARNEESHDPSGALWRGLVTTMIISLTGIAGATLWLLGSQYWAGAFLASAMGLIGATLASSLPRLLHNLRPRSERTMKMPLAGPAHFASALQAGVLPVIVLGASLSAAYRMGEYLGLEGGGAFGLGLGVAGMTAMLAYMLSINLSEPLAANVSRISQLKHSQLSFDSQRRTSRLSGSVFDAASASQFFFLLASTSAGTLAALVLLSSAPRPDALVVSAPALLSSAVIGAAMVLGYVGGIMSLSNSAARSALSEIERQVGTRLVRGATSDVEAVASGSAKIPANFTPNYKDTMDAVSSATLARAGFAALAAILAPALVNVGLAVWYRDELRQAAQSLLAFVCLAVVAALFTGLAALAMRGTGSASSGDSDPGHSNAVVGRFAAITGNAAGPTAQLFSKALAVVCLLLTPLL